MYTTRVHLTHTDCDGVGSVILDHLRNNHVGTHYVALNYDEIHGEDGTFIMHVTHPEIFTQDWDEIVVTDIALPLEFFISHLKNPKTPIKWFDHHPSSIEYMARRDEFPTVYMDNDKSRCGTKLYFDYLYQNIRTPICVRQFVDIVNTYDLWKKNDPLWPMAEDMNRFLSTQINYRDSSLTTIEKSMGFIQYMVKRLRDGRAAPFEYTFYERNKIMGVKQSEARYLAIAESEMAGKIRTDSRGYKWACTSSGAKISYIANQLVSKYNLDYIVVVNTFKGVSGRISIRSRDGYNINWLQDVAGHECAGGGMLPVKRLDEIWKQGMELGYKPDQELSG